MSTMGSVKKALSSANDASLLLTVRLETPICAAMSEVLPCEFFNSVLITCQSVVLSFVLLEG